MPTEEPVARERRPRRTSALPRLLDHGFSSLTALAALGTVVLLGTLALVLGRAALPSLRAYGFGFLTGSDWRPNELEIPARDAEGRIRFEDGETVMESVPPSFGALPVLWGTAMSSLLALSLAVPVGLGAALFLVRVCRTRTSAPLSFLIEFLAAVPSIAYGMWGLMVLAPLLQDHLEPGLQALLDVPGLGWLFRETIVVAGEPVLRELPLTGRDLLNGGLVLGIMVLPIVTALSRDVLRTQPREQLEGVLALGASWWQSSWAMLRFNRAGLLGAVLLGFARAAGETMAVTMVIGNNNQIRPTPFAPAQTMSSLLANEFAEATTELHRSALVEVALLLLVLSLLFNAVARSLVVGGTAHAERRA